MCAFRISNQTGLVLQLLENHIVAGLLYIFGHQARRRAGSKWATAHGPPKKQATEFYRQLKAKGLICMQSITLCLTCSFLYAETPRHQDWRVWRSDVYLTINSKALVHTVNSFSNTCLIKELIYFTPIIFLLCPLNPLSKI
jgi:hypothetical protein